MNNKLYRIGFLCLVLMDGAALCNGQVSLAKMQRDSLGGIKRFNVVVASGNFPDLASSIKTATELEMRKAGVTVIDVDDWNMESDGIVAVIVTILQAGTDSRLYLCSFRLEIKQAVLPLRETQLKKSVLATTWSDGTVALLGQSVYKDAIRRSVLDSVDAFLNDYLAANPDAAKRSKP